MREHFHDQSLEWIDRVHCSRHEVRVITESPHCGPRPLKVHGGSNTELISAENFHNSYMYYANLLHLGFGYVSDAKQF